VTPGTRVVEIALDDGTPIVAGGRVVPGAPAANIATIDFCARDGDQYPFRGAPFVIFAGVTYQQALSTFIQEDLGGVITAADYPESGKGGSPRRPHELTRVGGAGKGRVRWPDRLLREPREHSRLPPWHSYGCGSCAVVACRHRLSARPFGPGSARSIGSRPDGG
jgi:hypothetical protein